MTTLADIADAVTEFDEVIGNPGLCRKCGKHYEGVSCEWVAALSGNQREVKGEDHGEDEQH